MNSMIPFSSGDFSLRVLDVEGEPWFIAKEVADILGYSDTYEMTKRLDDDEKSNRQIAGLGSPTGGRGTTIINESGLYSAILGSTKPEAKPFKRWVTHEVLPAIRKSGSYTARQSRPTTLSRNQVAAGILLLRSAAEDLKFAPSAVLGGYQRLESQLGVTGLLPGYAVDSANTASGSSDETKAAGELLEQFGVGLSAIAFNRLLIQHGILEERERPSSKGGTKKFKVCVDLEFGKNLTSPNNPRETQPHWYVAKFQALLDKVIPSKPKAA
jgi:prophage antirepressor-like protein